MFVLIQQSYFQCCVCKCIFISLYVGISSHSSSSARMYEFTRHPLTMISSDGISVDQLDMQKHPPVVKYNLKTLLVKFDFSSTGTSTSIDASDKATTDNRRAIEWVKHLIDNSRKCPQFKLSYTAAMTLPLDKVLVPFNSLLTRHKTRWCSTARVPVLAVKECLREYVTGVAAALQELHGINYAHLDVSVPNICFAFAEDI